MLKLLRYFKKISPLLSFFLALFFITVPTLPVWASSYNYTLSVNIFNNGTNTYSKIPVLVTLNNSQLVTLGYLATNGLNSNLQEGGLDRVYSSVDTYLPGEQKTKNCRQTRRFTLHICF